MRKSTQTIRLACLVLATAVQTQAVESGPQAVVRQFCQSDGLGRRVLMPGWAAVAPLVAWSFEPAWDHVVLVSSYEVGSPRSDENDGSAVEVRYAVIGQVSALGFDTAVHLEAVELRLETSAGRWRIAGPPPPPHIFASRVDIDELRQSLQSGGLNFMPNSAFVWQLFRSAGWNVPFVASTDLLAGSAYRAVAKAHVGDLAVYLRDGVPYHVGVFEAEDRIVSSTLNAGIVRTMPDAFAGELKYLRLVEPETEPDMEAKAEPEMMTTPPASPRSGAAATPRPSRTRTVETGRRRTPLPEAQPGKHAAKSHPHAQPSEPERVTQSNDREHAQHPGPSATRQNP